MAVLFSFAYVNVPKDHKAEGEVWSWSFKCILYDYVHIIVGKDLRLLRVASWWKIATVVLFSFAYGNVPKDHKSEGEVWSMVHLKLQVHIICICTYISWKRYETFKICPDSPYWMMPLAGSGLKTEGNHLKIKKLTFLLLHNACPSRRFPLGRPEFQIPFEPEATGWKYPSLWAIRPLLADNYFDWTF